LRTIRQDAEIVARIGPVEIAVELEVAPAALALPFYQALYWRTGDHRKRNALVDVSRIALPGAERIGAHRAWAGALRTKHVAVDGERLLVAEHPAEIDRASLAFEAIVANDQSTGRQRASLSGDALDVA